MAHPHVCLPKKPFIVYPIFKFFLTFILLCLYFCFYFTKSSDHDGIFLLNTNAKILVIEIILLWADVQVVYIKFGKSRVTKSVLYPNVVVASDIVVVLSKIWIWTLKKIISPNFGFGPPRPPKSCELITLNYKMTTYRSLR